MTFPSQSVEFRTVNLHDLTDAAPVERYLGIVHTTHHPMKDITLLFCLALAIVLGITTLDQTLDRISDDAARRACHDLPGFYSSLETATSAAQQAQKPLAVVFGRREDPTTQKLKSDVLNSSVVNAIKDRFVWAYIDLDHENNRSNSSRFEIFDTPVTCVLDQQGRTVQRIHGASVPYLYVRQLQRSLAPSTPNPSGVTPASTSNPSKGNRPPRGASAAPSK
jgi:thioredoxin-related protein